MNKVILMGRLTRDPDVRYTQTNPSNCVARYTLAVNRRSKKEGEQTADFISCVAFGKNGEFADKYLHQGTKVTISGHIQTGHYTDRQGITRYTTDVVIEEQEFAESKASQERRETAAGSSPGQAAGYHQEPAPEADGDGFMHIPEEVEDELPFI